MDEAGMIMKNRDGKSEYFTRRMFYRYFIPSILSSIGLSLGNIVDSLVVGIKMGETGLAAIGLITPIYMIYNVFDLGIAIGGSVHFTKLLGEGKAERGNEGFNQMLFASLFISFAFSVIGSLFLPKILYVLGTNPSDGNLYEAARTYAGILIAAAPLFFLNFLLYYFIRCDNNQNLASTGLILGNAADIGLNFIFVIKLNMGVEGAILATLIGKAAAICIYLPHLLFHWSILRLKPAKPEVKLIWGNFKNGFASSSQFLFQFLFYIIINNLLLRIGGEKGVAVFGVVINISYILTAVYDGTGAALQPLTATFCGEKNKKAVKSTLSLALRWGIAIGVTTALVTGIFAGSFCRVFGLSDTTIAMGSRAVQLYCISTLAGGISILMGYYYQALERGRLVFLINFLRTFAVYLAVSLFFGIFGIRYFWWTFPVTEAMSCIIWMLWKRRGDKKDSTSNNRFDESRIYCKMIHKKEGVGTLLAEVQEFCSRWGAGISRQYDVKLVVEEICQAIMINGFGSRRNGSIELILISCEDNSYELHIRDNAGQYNPFDTKTKVMGKYDEGDEISDTGVLLVKKIAKDYFYRRYQGFNTLTIIV